jgi:hypothetical protein
MTEIEILNNSQLDFIQNAIYTVVMNSCSKDSANPTLVGKWQLVSYDKKNRNNFSSHKCYSR